MNTKREFGTRLKNTIKEKGFTQKELANKIGITSAMLSNYVRGINYPPTETLAALATILDVSADWLLGLHQYTAKRPPMSAYMRDGDFQTLGDVLRVIVAMDEYVGFLSLTFSRSEPAPLQEALIEYNKIRDLEMQDDATRKSLIFSWAEQAAERLDGYDMDGKEIGRVG